MDLQVTDEPDSERFEIRADGEPAGFVQYQLHDREIAFTHTETDNRFRGQGVGGYLIRSALEAARQRNLAVLPSSPFVTRWRIEHPQYADLVPDGRRSQFGL